MVLKVSIIVRNNNFHDVDHCFPFCLFLLDIGLSVILRFTASEFPLW